MAAPAAFAGQFGYKTETTWGTAVTVDKFLPFLSEGIKQEIARIESKGIRAGRRTTAKWRPGSKKVGGPVKLELGNVDTAPLLKHCFGAVNTTGSGPYTHTFTPGDLTGDSFTCQVGKPDVAGTVQPFTYAGAKVREWELTAKVDALAELTLDLTAKSETTGTALATASYSSSWAPFSFIHGSLTVAAGAVATLSEISLKGNNGLADDRHFVNGTADVSEQLERAVRAYTGSIKADFESLTAYNRYVNGTEAALVLTFNNGAGDTLTITCNVRFDGDTPTISSADELVEQSLPFVCLSATSDAAAITAVLVSADTTAA